MQKFVIQWHITHRCNLRCTHCYQEDYSKDLGLDDLLLIFEDIKNFLRINNYSGHINFTGGEPFISNNLWKLMDSCEKEGITFGVLTNGVLINDTLVSQLKPYRNLKFVQVSLDGIKSTHDSIRCKGSFDKTINGIRLLNKNDIQTMVSFTLSKSNKHELRKVIRLCEKEKVSRFWTDRLIPIGSNKLECLDSNDYSKCLKLLGYESRRAMLLPWVKTKVHTNRALQFVCRGIDSGVYECSAGKSLLTILADGILLPCRRLPIELGNLLINSLDDIYKSSDIIKELNTYAKPDGCSSCPLGSRCKGGAKCLSYALTGNWRTKDKDCMF